VVTRLGFDGVLSGNSSLLEVHSRLAEYPLAQTLGALSQLSSAQQFVSVDNPDLNRRLVTHVFEYKAGRVLQALDAHAREAAAEGSDVAVFDEAELIAAAKLALLTPTTGHVGPNRSPVRLGEALLMIGDLLSQETPPSDLTTPGALEWWTHYLVTNTMFYHRGDAVHDFARTYELYLTQHNTASGQQRIAQDFPALVKQATGLTAAEYWAIAFAFLAGWAFPSVDQALSKPGWIDVDTYFTSNFKFLPSLVERFFKLFSRSPEDLRLQIDPGALPFDPMPLAQYPLVQVSGKAYCPSVHLLRSKMTSGLYHLLLNALVTPREKDIFHAHLGDVVNEYVQRLFERVYARVSARLQGRYFSEREIRTALASTGEKMTLSFCDGIILDGDAAILIEVKASRFSLARRTGQDPVGFLEKLHEIFIDGLAQIEETIRHIDSGRLTALGLNPDRLRRILPLIVTLEPISMRAPVYQYISGKSPLRPSARLEPWQHFTIPELECAEGAMLGGKSLRKFLTAKVADGYYRAESATNYSYSAGDRFAFQKRSPYLESIYTNLTEQARAFYRNHARDTQVGIQSPTAGEDS
jgi:hypothetical protein